MKWVYEQNTGPTGWYAVLRCWDPREGIFPGAVWWYETEGGRWEGTGGVIGHAGPFVGRTAAEKWAYDNDPEFTVQTA